MSSSAVAVLAQGLRELRDFAEGPDGPELAERTGLTGQQIEAALAGERLPTREVTLALVEAWEGDVEAWREYWAQISELAEEDEAEDGGERTEKAATPAPPEPSIIVPIPEMEPELELGPEQAEADNAEAEAVRARSAARAQLEANAQAAKAQSEAKAAAEESARDEGDVEEEDAENETSARDEDDAEVADAEDEDGTSARAESAGTGAAEEDSSVEEAGAEAPGALSAARVAARPASAALSTEASASIPGKPATPGHPVGAQPPKPKKSMLARVGVPILLFAIGVGVGAFGDHALNSKHSSTNTPASVPSVSRPSSSGHTSTSSAGVPSSSAAATPTTSVNPTATTPTDTSSGSSTTALGTTLGTYPGIQLASGYSINFLSDPFHPAAGTSNGADTMGFFAGSFVDGRFYADRVAVLDQTDTGSYSSCLNDTRYQHDVLLSQVSAGSSFCITTGTGHLVLVTVRRMPSSTDANPYAVLDVTVWQSS